MSIRKYIKLLFLLAWCLVIYSLSADTGSVSQELSDSILNIILPNILVDYFSLFIRKLAHFSEYFVLFILAATCFKDFFKSYLTKAWLFVFLFSLSDEFHQLFVPGRSGELKDIFIDVLGGSLACLLIYYARKRV